MDGEGVALARLQSATGRISTHESHSFMPDLRESAANLALYGYPSCKSAYFSDRLLERQQDNGEHAQPNAGPLAAVDALAQHQR